MVTSRHQLLKLAAVFLAPVILCQCETVRTEGEIRRGSIKFDDATWGGQGGSDDTKEIRSKFAERGYSVDENGKLIADRPNLYSNQGAQGASGNIDKKQARLANNKATTKQFKTPEYLKRQQFDGASQSRFGEADAREGNFSQSRDKQAGKLFNRKSNSSTSLSNYDTNAFRDSNRAFDATQNKAVNRAIQSPLDAQGSAYQAGYQDGALSMDDVKRLLNPGSFARAEKLD